MILCSCNKKISNNDSNSNNNNKLVKSTTKPTTTLQLKSLYVNQSELLTTQMPLIPLALCIHAHMHTNTYTHTRNLHTQHAGMQIACVALLHCC